VIILLRAFSLVIFLLGITGLTLHSQLRETGHLRQGMFVYYTNLSNLVIAIYQLALFISSFFPQGRLFALLTDETVFLSATLCIFITHLVYHFVLLPAFRKKKGPAAECKIGFGNRCVHYLVPWGTVLEWVFCAEKTSLSVVDAAWWLLVPCAYLAFILLRGISGRPIDSGGFVYPYPFMDLKKLGTGKFLRNCVLLLIGYFALGLLFVGFGRLIA
jgi:hypothetical protein